MTEPQTTRFTKAIGGDPTVRALTRRFYELMDSLPEAANCRAIHPRGSDRQRGKFYEYLTGWLGGPPIYVQKRGPPPCCAAGNFICRHRACRARRMALCFTRALGRNVSTEARDIILEPITRPPIICRTRNSQDAETADCARPCFSSPASWALRRRECRAALRMATRVFSAAHRHVPRHAPALVAFMPDGRTSARRPRRLAAGGRHGTLAGTSPCAILGPRLFPNRRRSGLTMMAGWLAVAIGAFLRPEA